MQIITVASFKGGTAKTSVSLNLGAVLAKVHKKRVLLIDFDAQSNLTTGLGFDPDAYDSMAPVLQGTKQLHEVILETETKNLHIVPADTWLERIEVTEQLAQDRYSHERLKGILSRAEYDFIIIDTPPSLCWLTESAMIASNKCLICATPEFYSVKGLYRLGIFISQISKRHPVEVLGVLLSFWNERGKSNQAFLNVIEETFPQKILKTKIRRDKVVADASIRGKPIVEISRTSRALDDFKKLAREVLRGCKTDLHLKEEASLETEMVPEEV